MKGTVHEPGAFDTLPQVTFTGTDLYGPRDLVLYILPLCHK